MIFYCLNLVRSARTSLGILQPTRKVAVVSHHTLAFAKSQSLPSVHMNRAHLGLTLPQQHQFRIWARRWLRRHAQQCALAQLKGIYFSVDNDGCLVIEAIKGGKHWDMLSWPDPPQPRFIIPFRSYRVTCRQCASHAVTKGRKPKIFRSLFDLWQAHCGSTEAKEVFAKLEAGATVEFLGGNSAGFTAALLR